MASSLADDLGMNALGQHVADMGVTEIVEPNPEAKTGGEAAKFFGDLAGVPIASPGDEAASDRFRKLGLPGRRDFPSTPLNFT